MDAKTAIFERHRPRLFRIAYRMLGTVAEAEDAVQEAFLRWLKVDEAAAPGRLLATIVTRLCLDVLKSARVQRQEYVGPWLPELVVDERTPESRYALADDLTFGFMTMLERLTPEQRVVYVLRVAFDLDYEEIAEVLGSSAASCRQMMRRARAQISGPVRYEVDRGRSLELARRFAAACNQRSRDGIMAVLAADCRLVSDSGGHLPSARKPILGADRVGRLLLGLRRRYEAILEPLDRLSGASPLLRYVQRGYTGIVALDVADDARIAEVFLQWNPAKLRHLAALELEKN